MKELPRLSLAQTNISICDTQRTATLKITSSYARVGKAYKADISRQGVEAVHYIHFKGVIHSDLAARQFLLDTRLNARISDFGTSSFEETGAVGFENPMHHLPRDTTQPNTVQTDLLALRLALYEIWFGEAPYHDGADEEIEELYKQQKFPSLEAVGEPWNQIIKGCWMCQYSSASEILHQLDSRSLPALNCMLCWRCILHPG
jgi:serine/threonine protein kinase